MQQIQASEELLISRLDATDSRVDAIEASTDERMQQVCWGCGGRGQMVAECEQQSVVAGWVWAECLTAWEGEAAVELQR